MAIGTYALWMSLTFNLKYVGDTQYSEYTTALNVLIMIYIKQPKEVGPRKSLALLSIKVKVPSRKFKFKLKFKLKPSGIGIARSSTVLALSLFVSSLGSPQLFLILTYKHH